MAQIDPLTSGGFFPQPGSTGIDPMTSGGFFPQASNIGAIPPVPKLVTNPDCQLPRPPEDGGRQ